MNNWMSSREANQSFGKAQRAADREPLTITKRGKPAYVLLRHDAYERLTGPRKSIVDMLSQDEPEADFDFDPPKLGDDMGLRIPDFSED
jgi:prevent-host-death family protein